MILQNQKVLDVEIQDNNNLQTIAFHSRMNNTRSPQLRKSESSRSSIRGSKGKKAQLNDFCKTTPLHGFQAITSANQRWKRALWGIFIFLSCGIGTYQIVKIICDYLQYNTAYDVTMKDPASLKFPDVMVCDSNPLNFTFVNTTGLVTEGRGRVFQMILRLSVQWNLKDALELAHDYHVDPNDNATKPEAAAKARGMHDIINRLERKKKELGLSFKELVLKFGHDPNQFFAYCTQGKIQGGHPLQQNCSVIARPLIYHKYGVCYVIRGITQKKADPVFGGFGALLNVHLVLKRDHYSPRSYRPEGVYIGIAYKYEAEFDSQLLSAVAKTFTMIHLKPKKIENINHPYIACRPGLTETEDACKKRCEMKIFKAICKCIPLLHLHLIPEEDNITETCEVRPVLDCLYRKSTEINDSNAECLKTCIEPCVEWDYETTESDMKYFITEEASAKDKEWVDKTNVQLFMTGLEYTLSKQFYTITFEGLLGSIGGLFGIYLGGSMLAILHCLFTIIEERH